MLALSNLDYQRPASLELTYIKLDEAVFVACAGIGQCPMMSRWRPCWNSTCSG